MLVHGSMIMLLLASSAPAPINAVVGDASWIERFGYAPTMEDAGLRDAERHRVHLAWIERRLRARSVSHLTAAQRRMRASLLDALAEYQAHGVRPINGQALRRPRFVDREGRVCAVGYMILASGRPDLLKRLNRLYEYDYLLDIDDPALAKWIAQSGFTARELASIQPTYTGAGTGAAVALVGAGALLGGSMVLGGDIALLATALHYGERGFGDGLAALELIWGALHLSAIAGLVATAEQGGVGAPIAFGVVAAVGTYQVGHALYSLIRPNAAPPSTSPALALGVSPLPEGAMLTLAGRL